MNPAVNNILTDIPRQVPEELLQTLLTKGSVKIERIVSQGHSSSIDEWIILIEGQAKLIFENNSSPVLLKSGDYLFIPSHTKHRVHWTDPDRKHLASHSYLPGLLFPQ